MVTYNEIKSSEEVRAYVKLGNENLRILGFTDHSEAHTALVAERAALILENLGYSEHTRELVKIAGFMHDIGNTINRKAHAEYGGILADNILRNFDMEVKDRVAIVSAIAHHDESTGGATDAISAALIVADKTDVRKSRVIEKNRKAFDIHDRVNYAVTENDLLVDAKAKKIILELKIDESICTMYEYFDIFLERMLMSRSAAEMLGMTFSLRVNGSRIL